MPWRAFLGMFRWASIRKIALHTYVWKACLTLPAIPGLNFDKKIRCLAITQGKKRFIELVPWCHPPRRCIPPCGRTLSVPGDTSSQASTWLQFAARCDISSPKRCDSSCRPRHTLEPRWHQTLEPNYFPCCILMTSHVAWKWHHSLEPNWRHMFYINDVTCCILMTSNYVSKWCHSLEYEWLHTERITQRNQL